MKQTYSLIIALFFLGLGFTQAQTYTDLVDMNNATAAPYGSDPLGDLVNIGGTFFGMTQSGGVNGFGMLFSYNPVTTKYTDLVDLNSATAPKGRAPSGDVINVSGTLYGMTRLGGAHADGVIFSYDTSTHVYTDLYDFSGTADGRLPEGSLLAIGNVLYGTTSAGGANNTGTIFSYTIGGSFSLLYSFANGAQTGESPEGSLTPSVTGDTLYGLASAEGYYGDGVLFSFVISGSAYTDIVDLWGSIAPEGANPVYTTMVRNNNLLYGMTAYGGADGDGVIFSYNIKTTAYTDLYDFSGGTGGSNPLGSLIISGNALIGMTSAGGASENGNIFSYNTSSHTYSDLYDFTGSGTNGLQPYGGLTFLGSKLYGMTSLGGSHSQGNIFSFLPNCTLAASPSSTGTILCYGEATGNATAGANGGTGAYTYSWENEATSVVQSTTSPSGAVLSGGACLLTVTDNTGLCKVTATLTITQPTALHISATATDSVICPGSGGCTTLNSVPSGGTGAYSYSWTPTGSTASIVVCPTATVTTYTNTVKDANGCTGTASVNVHVSTCTGIQEVSNTNDIEVYPNPSSGVFTLQITNYELGITNQVEVYNVLGEKVYSAPLSTLHSQFSINLNDQSPGIYILKIQSAEQTIVKRIIKL